MSDLLLMGSLVAFFIYGYCMMARLDRYVEHAGHRHAVSTKLQDTFHAICSRLSGNS